VPEASQDKPGVDPERILHEWKPDDVRALFERGIFNDIIYGAVRFRNRVVRELLAAEWFHYLLSKEQSRTKIENLFFREPILPWLILLDDNIRVRAVSIRP
jgi:hypothetical protein